ncbi:hydrogenase 4 subunit B [Xanthobacter sp. V4C-4]|uniref:hydrogenase 4 subunit B n=1 Tax=Xanthobacter cornucopiae TaxID=3119924 RepID=UPI0037268CA5
MNAGASLAGTAATPWAGTPLAGTLCAILAFALVAGLAVAVARRPSGRPLVYGTCAVIGGLGFASGLSGLFAAPAALTLPLGLPVIGAHLRLDALSAFFVLVVNLGGVAASLYALGYGRHEQAPERVLPFFPAFLGAMNLVLVAGDAYAFLFGWELMSLASWAMVVSHDKSADALRAGFVYILMATFGTLALMLAFALLAGSSGAYAFDAMAGGGHGPLVTALVLALALVGAGSKAGLMPLHVWLPLAHPAAPSHVSALMSGVMTKVAVYGFIRIVFDLAGPPHWWWGIPVLAAGGITAALGVLQALFQSDMKRVLAFSTIENIGIIFVGLGLALAFKGNGLEAAGALALTAGLFHVLNHALFKTLLFFGAGAVLNATGARDLEKLGGLIHAMPTTAAVMLVGCAAISALPPLNGFASEWLTFQAILLSPALAPWGLKLLVPAVGALLALAAALAAACFVRLYGIAFLGRARSEGAAQAHEVDRWSRGSMIGLATLCVLAGILPGPVIDALQPVVAPLMGARMPVQSDVDWLSIIPVGESRSSYNGLLVFVFIALSAGLAALLIHRFASRALRRAPAWDCGFPDPVPLAQYSASSFAQPIRRVFGAGLFRAREQVTMPPPGDASPAHIQLSADDPAWTLLFTPLAGAVNTLSERANALQHLTIRQYLGIVFLALLALLLVLAIWP